MAPFLRRAAVAYREERYDKIAQSLGKGGGTMNLLYPGLR